MAPSSSAGARPSDLCPHRHGSDSGPPPPPTRTLVMAWGPPRRPRLISFALSTPFCLPGSIPVPLEFAFRDGSEEPPPHSLASWNIFCQLIELTRFLAGAAIPLRLSNSGPRRGRPLGLYDTPLIMPTVALHFTAHTWATCPALASSPERWYPWQLIRGGVGGAAGVPVPWRGSLPPHRSAVAPGEIMTSWRQRLG